MIKSAEIKNFRCFESVSLRDCRLINVVVGKNASGKTSLLEALFLAIGPSPEIALRFRGWRGYEAALSGTFEDIEDAIWSDLFFQFKKEREIVIRLRGTGKHKRSLNISYGTSEQFVQISEKEDAKVFPQSAMEFKWTRHDRKVAVVRPRFTGTAFQFPGIESPAVDATFFNSAHVFVNAENVKRFSSLSKTRSEEPVVKAFTREFGFIGGVDIQAHAGVSMLHANISSMPVKVPLNMISSGVIKFATLLLAIAEHKRSILFVDEIENGFHYERLESIWTTLHQFCKENEVQLFASTHSRECLEALARACEKSPDDVSIIRSELVDGSAMLDQFKGSAAFKGLTIGEIR